MANPPTTLSVSSSTTILSSDKKLPSFSQPSQSVKHAIPKIVFDLDQEPRGSERTSSDLSGPILLDPYDSHLDLTIESDGRTTRCIYDEGFQYLWKGTRATHGVKSGGKYYYEVLVTMEHNVVMPETAPRNQNVCRVGVSAPLSDLFLGCNKDSWGFGGTGKKSTDNTFSDYGEAYAVGDVIGVVVDLDNLVVAFSKNGKFLGTAFDLPMRVRQTGLLPHILVKNVDFEVNFERERKWFDPPGPEISFFSEAPLENRIRNPVDHPQSPNDAEFIMMVGLPACGKTYWAEQHMARNPAKNYVLLGTNAIIDQMKVMGIKRQRNYADRWKELMSTATPIFNRLIVIASQGRPTRNVILDQTNVFKNARRRKASSFSNWGTRRCVTIVTDDRTLSHRTQKREREEGKMVPVSAVMDMKANFALPMRDEGFSDIDFVELPEIDVRREIQRMNAEGRQYKRDNPGLLDNQPRAPLVTRKAEEIGNNADYMEPKKRRLDDGCYNYQNSQGDVGFAVNQRHRAIWDSGYHGHFRSHGNPPSCGNTANDPDASSIYGARHGDKSRDRQDYGARSIQQDFADSSDNQGRHWQAQNSYKAANGFERHHFGSQRWYGQQSDYRGYDTMTGGERGCWNGMQNAWRNQGVNSCQPASSRHDEWRQWNHHHQQYPANPPQRLRGNNASFGYEYSHSEARGQGGGY